jgi:hypothetical protein
VPTGLAIGMAVVAKSSLGAAIAVAVGAAVGAQALGSGEGRLRALLARGAVLVGASLVPVVAMAAWYGAQGAFEPLWDRLVLSLGAINEDARVAFPPLAPWRGSGAELFRLQYAYFPPVLSQWASLHDVWLYAGPAGPAVEWIVKALFTAPLAAAGAALATGLLRLRRPGGGADASRWVLVGAFGLLAVASVAYRIDFTHLMNTVPALLLPVAALAARWCSRSWRIAIPVVATAAWFAAGGLAAVAVFDTHDTRLDTPRGSLHVTSLEAADARRVLDWAAAQPADARIAFLRTIPIFYFLTGRPIVGGIDLFLPFYFRGGDDARVAHEIAALDAVVYNPNELVWVPRAITDFAPDTAGVLARRFEPTALLAPTAVLFERARTAPPEGAAARPLAPAPEGRDPGVRSDSWLVYPVVVTPIPSGERRTCFESHDRPARGDVLEVRPMFAHQAWTRRHWPDAGRAARITIDAREGGRTRRLHRARLEAGLPDEELRIGLDDYAGRNVTLRFCAHRPGRVAGELVVGWADPRIAPAGATR